MAHIAIQTIHGKRDVRIRVMKDAVFKINKLLTVTLPES
jgi:hypothetical protein